jgi:hypothetical protein
MSCVQYCMVFYVLLAHASHMYPQTSGVYPMRRVGCGVGWEGSDMCHVCSIVWWCCSILAHVLHMYPHTSDVYPVLRTTVLDCTIRCYVGLTSTQCCAVSFVCMQYELGQLHRAGSNCTSAAVAVMRANMPCLPVCVPVCCVPVCCVPVQTCRRILGGWACALLLKAAAVVCARSMHADGVQRQQCLGSTGVCGS